MSTKDHEDGLMNMSMELRQLVERGERIFKWLKTQENPNVENLWPNDARALVAANLKRFCSEVEVKELGYFMEFTGVVPPKYFDYTKVITGGFEGVGVLSDSWRFCMYADAIKGWAEAQGYEQEAAYFITHVTNDFVRKAYEASGEQEVVRVFGIEMEKAVRLLKGIVNADVLPRAG